MLLSIDEQLAIMRSGAEELIPEQGLRERLQSSNPLKIKAGFDPTAPDLHLGHTVLLNKLRQFQELGHEIIFVIGDLTALVGDPTGKNATRKPLTRDQIDDNARTYTEQVFKILDPSATRVVFNSRWLSKLSFVEIIQLAAKYNVARMLERDDFNQRYKGGVSIALHEFLYPLMQAYDSVVLEADVEIGGTDQKFNLLLGRHMQQEYGQKPQVVMTMPILEGLDGTQKMSKSLGNYVGVADPPDEMFGKLMSISDKLMWRYFDLLSHESPASIAAEKMKVEQGSNPRDAKIALAREMVARFHSQAEAERAEAEFASRFRNGALPSDILSIQVMGGAKGMLITNLLQQAGLTKSTSEAMRLIEQKAVRVDGERIEDTRLWIEPASEHLYQVGKRKFVRVFLAPLEPS